MQANHESIAVIEETTTDAEDAGMAGEQSPGEGQPEAARPADESLAGWVQELRQSGKTAGAPRGLPILPETSQESSDDRAGAILQAVRRFYRSSLLDGDLLARPDEQLIPALLHPFRDQRKVRHDYPLVLMPADASEGPRPAMPLSDLLQRRVSTFAPGDSEARILKDNLARLERRVVEMLAEENGPVATLSMLTDAAAAILKELSLGGDNERLLDEDFKKLLEGIHPEATLTDLGPDTEIILFIHAARCRVPARQKRLAKEIRQVRDQLRDLLRTNQAKSDDGRGSKSLGKTVGDPSAKHIDPQRLSKVIGSSRGAPPMDSDRLQRLETIVGTLEKHLARGASLLTVIHTREIANIDLDDGDILWKQVEADVCETAAQLFDEQAQRYAELFGALRVGRLELEDSYDPSHHDVLFESFCWEYFSREELLDLPPILALETAEQLAGAGMFNLSRLLLSHRKVEILISVRPEHDPNLESDGSSVAGNRFELAYLGISHRETQVHQSSTARPHHLLDGYLAGLDATCGALQVVAEHCGSWLQAAAALESRAHPFSHYNPEAGASWARRFDLTENPQPEASWPEYELPCRGADGEETSLALAFTFADFALLEKKYREHFRVIPDLCPTADLIELDQYLALESGALEEKAPFIWGADGEGKLHRVAVSRRMVVACGDRLDYWRTLQELAGIHNEHVREAVQYEREQLKVAFSAERQKLQAAHEAQLEKVRNETASAAFANLAQRLLDTDATALASSMLQPPQETSRVAPTGTPPQEAPPEASTEETPAAADEEEDEEVSAEPWIDSALCTTCNDCMQINAQLFLYNANKQAYLGDPDTGTFADLVKGAEICPAKCIHPGMPANSSEPNLPELIERAKPFQ